MKRGAAVQINKDAPEEQEDNGEDADGWKEASAEKIAKRKIIKVKRQGDVEKKASAGSSLPSFSFASAEAQPEAPAAESKKAVNPLAAFLKPKSNWTCSSCLLSNEKDLTKCKACETPKDGAAADSSAEAKSSEAAPASTEFTFGSGDVSSFTFGSNTDTTFTFGSVAADAASKTDDFTSGGGQFQFDEASGPVGSSSEPAATADLFKGQKQEERGDDGDTVHHTVLCKVFQLKKVPTVDEQGKVVADAPQKEQWCEAGKGNMNVNTTTRDGQTIGRLILRVEKTKKLMLNAPLLKQMNVAMQDEKYIKLGSFDLEGKVAIFLLRFRNKADTQECFDKIKEVLAKVE